MSKGICVYCGRIVIEDLDKYKEEYPNEKEVECPYCHNLVRLK